MHWIDITLIVILVIFALVGLKRGLISAILSLFSTFASGFIAWWVAKPFAGFIENVFHVTKYLVEFSSKTLVGWSASFGEAVSEATTGGAVISSSGLSTWQQVILKILVGENTVVQAGETPANVFANVVAPIILIVLAGIVAFILIKLAVFLLSKLFDALKKNHAINGMDKVLGLILGLAKGALLICIAMGVTIFIPNEKIIAEIDKTTQVVNGDTEINNLYGLDSKANIIWQSEDISTRFPDFKNLLPYEQFGIKDGYIFASDFLGRNYQINAVNGKIENCCLVR